MKKNVKIIIIVVLVIIIIVGGYFLWQFLKNKDVPKIYPTPTPGYTAAPIPTISPSPNTTSTITPPEGKLSIWGKSEIVGFFFKNGSALAVKTDGQVLSIRGDSETVKNSTPLKEQILNIIPSFDGKWFIEKWGSTSNPRFSLYDTDNNSWTNFKDIYFTDMDFSPSESKIIYLEELAGKVSMGIMDLTKKTNDQFTRTPIMSLSLKDIGVTWANSDTIILNDKPSYRVPASLWKYSLSNNRIDLLVTGKNGLWAKWDKKSGYGIEFSHTDTDKLEIINKDGETMFTSSLISFPDKCVTLLDSLYCAIPQNIGKNKSLPDDYLKRAFYTNDTFYKYSLKTGELKELYVASNPARIDALNLILENGKIYFINRYDHRLYQLSIN